MKWWASATSFYHFISPGVEHGQHDLHPNSFAPPGQRDSTRRVQGKTLLWSRRQHSKGWMFLGQCYPFSVPRRSVCGSFNNVLFSLFRCGRAKPMTANQCYEHLDADLWNEFEVIIKRTTLRWTWNVSLLSTHLDVFSFKPICYPVVWTRASALWILSPQQR